MNRKKNVLKWSIFVVVLMCLVASGIIAWRMNSNYMSALTIPTPKMPEPNGYDHFIAAGKLLKDQKNKIGFTAIDDRFSTPSTCPDDRVYSIAEKAALVKANDSALVELRKGFQYDCRAYPLRSFDVKNPEWASFRTLARLLKLDADVKSNQGDWNGAMNSCLHGMEMGTDVTRGGNTVHGLVGMAVESIDRREAWEIVEHLSAEEARSAAARLEKIINRRASFIEMLEEEKYYVTASLIESYEKLNLDKGSPDKKRPTLSSRFWMFYDKRRIIHQYIKPMDKLISASHKPYPAFEPPAMPERILSAFVSENQEVYYSYTLNDCGSKLLLLSLALRACKLDQGEYPAKLSDLAPDYVKTLPSDPFALSGSFKYKLSGNSYTLYSIGPDGKDDLGKPVFNPSKKGSLRYHVGCESKGDIVAGIHK